MEVSVTELLEILAADFSVASKADERNVQRLICDSKVTDHHAILPTKASLGVDVAGLPVEKSNIYSMVATRLASAAAGVKHMEKTYVEVTCEGKVFKAKGTVTVKPGFQAVEDAFMAGYVKNTKPEAATEDISVVTILDEVFEGMEIEHPLVEKSKHYTQPPKAFTEDTLLAAMEKAGSKEMDNDVERKGLGTPATRAGIIEKLVGIDYIRRKSKKLIPTEKGRQVVSVLPDKLKSAELTAEWENMLSGVERGKATGKAFMANIFDLVDEVLEGLDSIPQEERNVFSAAGAIGNCPACGNPVVVGKGNYHCSQRECAFILWEDARYLESMKAKIDRKTAEALLAHGRVQMKGLYSKKSGKTFNADLVLGIGERGRAEFKLEFAERKRGKDGAR